MEKKSGCVPTIPQLLYKKCVLKNSQTESGIYRMPSTCMMSAYQCCARWKRLQKKKKQQKMIPYFAIGFCFSFTSSFLFVLKIIRTIRWCSYLFLRNKLKWSNKHEMEKVSMFVEPTFSISTTTVVCKCGKKGIKNLTKKKIWHQQYKIVADFLLHMFVFCFVPFFSSFQKYLT